MKLLLVITFIFFNSNHSLFGQIDKFKNWDKILIFDNKSESKRWSFSNSYQIDRTYNITKIERTDSIIKTINTSILNEILDELKIDYLSYSDPLKMFERDTNWLFKNADSLWLSFEKKSNSYEPYIFEDKTVAVSTIRDYNLIQNTIKNLNNVEYEGTPKLSIYFICDNDTLKISSKGEFPYLLPWENNGKLIYNSKVSTLIAQLIPEIKNSNVKYLRGDFFDHFMIEEIYYDQIMDKTAFLKAKKRYFLNFKILSKKLLIVRGSNSLMSSIEWGSDFSGGAYCINIELKDKKMAENIVFSTVFGCRFIFMHSVIPLLRKKNKIIAQLQQNPIYKYTEKNENSKGEIHFVNKASFSKKAKKHFLEDLKKNNIDSKQFDGKLDEAIFYELTEYRNKKRSFSRWIFLQDGTIILWEKKGDFLLNIPTEKLPLDGYICKVMMSDEIK